MWVMTRFGFFSTCRAHTRGVPHPNLMMMRARKRQHLQALKKAYPFIKAGIKSGGGTDYPYRIYITTAHWRRLAELLADDVDYTNFKSAARDTRPNDTQYNEFLHSVWGAGLRLEAPARPPVAVATLWDEQTAEPW